MPTTTLNYYSVIGTELKLSFHLRKKTYGEFYKLFIFVILERNIQVRYAKNA